MKKLFCGIIRFVRSAPEVAAAGFSVAMLATAYGFEYLGGYVPCDLCWTQRYAHMGVVALGVLLGLSRPIWQVSAQLRGGLLSLALLGSAGIAGYHAGVEYKWWEGPSACSASSEIGSFSTDQLLNNLMNAPLISCGDIPWHLFGISMAGYNFLLSFGMALLLWGSVKGNKDA
ncbi:disulfide bond formation protein B [Luteithermobacter gelatinilyticus]|uniref:disulfide bond formation protein B n=1 Tax=Luteithermobacter gelatinilyticus TaxID=2582913 RepID=UPI0011057861|nr:disulfide bond formation protein B [Luteithermobacter gelatinilyticus]